MPIKILTNGASVLLDDEDFELVEAHSWHVYRMRPSMKSAVARIETRYGRMFRLHLHREVAARQQPELVKIKFRVYPRNGDYLDCRRENLEVALARKKRGVKPIEPRPFGWQRTSGRRGSKADPTSRLWAGGVTVERINRTRYGEGDRFRLCRGGVPID